MGGPNRTLNFLHPDDADVLAQAEAFESVVHEHEAVGERCANRVGELDRRGARATFAAVDGDEVSYTPGAGGVFVLGGLKPADYEIEPFPHRGAIGEAIALRVDRSIVACDLHLTAVKETGVRVVTESGAAATGVWVAANLFGLRRGVGQAGDDGVVKLPIAASSEFEVRMGEGFASCEIKEFDTTAEPMTIVIAQP